MAYVSRHGGINNTEHMELILNHIQHEKELHFQNQHSMQFKQIPPSGDPFKEGRVDRLIDVCLYFIAPHRFKPMDEEYIAQLSRVVSVVPICAKADAMTLGEREEFQRHIRTRLTDSKSCLLSHAPVQALQSLQLFLEVHASQCISALPYQHCIILSRSAQRWALVLVLNLLALDADLACRLAQCSSPTLCSSAT